MALNRLTIAEMVSLTEDWCKPGHPERIALERVPGITPLMPRIITAHEQLLTAQRMALTKTISELSAARKRTDDRFDGLARAIHAALEAHIQLAQADGDPIASGALRNLRAFLFPNQLKVVTFSYREEAGQAKLLASRMTTDDEQLLSSIPMRGGTLLDTVHAWIDVGLKLGELEDEYANMQLPDRRLPVAKAAAGWRRVVRTVRSVVELSEAVEPLVEDTFGRIALAEAVADRRSSATGNVDDPTEPVVSEAPPVPVVPMVPRVNDGDEDPGDDVGGDVVESSENGDALGDDPPTSVGATVV